MDASAEQMAAAPTAPAVPAVPAAPRRIKVSPTQAELLIETARAVQLAQAHLAEQEQKANITQALVFDAHGITPGPGIGFDPATKELVIESGA